MALARKYVRAAAISTLVGAVVASAIVILATLHRPIGSLASADPATHHLRQSEEFTCGPAAVSEALSYYGVHASERALAMGLGTTRRGTSPVDVARIVGGKLAPFPLSAPGRVFVVDIGFRYSYDHHFVCAFGEADGWTVNDPRVESPEHWTNADFSQAVVAVEVLP